MDVIFDIIDVAFRSSKQMPKRARYARKPLRSEDNQRYHSNNQDFRKADIEHCLNYRLRG